MPSSLKNDLEKQVNKRMKCFLERVSEKSGVNVSELEGMWNEACGVKAKKVSNFQVFCNHPNLSILHYYIFLSL